MDIVKILGVGLSGFGFLLMYLAYRLILKMMPDPKANMIKMINRYMLICLAMTLSVGIFTYIDAIHKSDLIQQQTQQIAQKDTALNLITTSQKNHQLSDTVLYYTGTDNTSDTNKANKAKDDQKKALDSLSTYFGGNDNSNEAVKFNIYKDSVLKFTELLQNKRLPKDVKEAYRVKYVDYNNAISRLTMEKAGFQKIKSE
jgi:predicted PurR-regulated permease PerM